MIEKCGDKRNIHSVQKKIYPSNFELCCHSPRNAPALETISTALPTIVCSPELAVVGEANPLLDVVVVMVLMMGLTGDEEDTAVKDVLGFARRGGGGMRGGGRSLVGDGINGASSVTLGEVILAA